MATRNNYGKEDGYIEANIDQDEGSGYVAWECQTKNNLPVSE